MITLTIMLTIMQVVILKEQKKFVTMSDIARELGVSVNTVSRALRGKDDISEVTTRKIEEKASELGFIRNFSASSLRTNKSHIVGVILEDSVHRTQVRLQPGNVLAEETDFAFRNVFEARYQAQKRGLAAA